jgi:CMP-N-acetylneuraminic acid synthetase
MKSPKKLFVNVRLESQRLPEKPLQLIGQKPLFFFALEKFSEFDVYIDAHPASLVHRIRADLPWVKCYERFPEHASNINPGTAMFERFLDEHVADLDEPVGIYHLTSPFLEPRTVHQAFSALVPPFDSVATVTVIRNFIYRKQVLPSGSLRFVPVNFDARETPRTQDMEEFFMLNHACFVLTKRLFKASQSKVGFNPCFIETRFPESWDIDYPEDLALARSIIATDRAQ